MEPYFTKFEMAHFDGLDIPEDSWVTREMRGMVEAYAAAGPAVSLVADGKIIGCGGVAFPWMGMGEAWMCMDVEFKNHPKTAVKMCKAFLDDVYQACDMFRMQATIRADDGKLRKWIELMGFGLESRMKSFGPDRSDYLMYARVKGGMK